ncbi:MAG: diguanylate cyclase [Sulfuricella sp.]|nr:diguanylate cyclase [Sulfuricella sp.]
MTTPTNPTDIARETLKLLASRRVAPTPDNYLKLYNEIAGIEPAQDGGVENVLHKVLQDAFREDPSLAREFAGFERALGEHDWKGIEQGMAGLLRGRRNGKDTPWGALIRDLLKEWETKRSGLTAPRKKESLERVLSNFSSDAFVLHEKLQALVHRWAETPISVGIEAVADAPEAAGGSPVEVAKQELVGVKATDMTGSLRELIAQVLEDGLGGRLSQIPDLHEQTVKLAKMAREAGDSAALEKFSKELKKFWFQLELRGEDDAKVLDGLFRLLRLLIDNISELVVDGDQWLLGQIAVVQEIISHPIDSRMLFDAERGLKEVIFKQGNLKHSLDEAKNTLKNMIATFVNRLGEMSDSTGGYHDKIEDYSLKLRKAEDINQMNAILGDILRDTKNMQSDIQRTRDELNEARREVGEAEMRVRQLEIELQQVSEKVREDQLTGALNRHGMEEVFHRELAHAERHGTPLSLALLDLDNFKRLNDTYGHQTGDAALVHLTKVIKDIIRPTDEVARYGGEEFIIVLPETNLEDGVHVVTRLQRELTKRFFLHNNERLLITFSAGVALRGDGEMPDSMIARADAALYKAKQAGKNRVFPAE